MKWLSAVPLVLLLTGCQTGSSAQEHKSAAGNDLGTYGCTSMHDAGASMTSTLSPSCPDCSVSNEALAVDNDEGTHATMQTGELGFDTFLRATAQPGVVFPAGARAAAFADVDIGPGGYETGPVMVVRTYLGDALQESVSYRANYDRSSGADVQACGEYCRWHNFPYVLESTKPFDAVEFGVSTAQGAFRSYTVSVHELCSNGDPL